jgi:hypothetical protein
VIYLTLTRIKRAFAVLRFGILVLRYAGLWAALQKLGHQLYGRTVFYGTVKRLDDPPSQYTFDCYVALASPEDIDEFFSNIGYESNEGKYQLLVRKWYDERGFGDCYVTKVKGTDEICAARWMVTKKHLEEMGWLNRFSEIGDKDVLLENVYVLERFRRMGVQQSGSRYMNKICLEMGFSHAKGWVAEDNIPELMSCLKSGWPAFEKVEERHFLFRVTRKILEIYSPPIPVTIPSREAQPKQSH